MSRAESSLDGLRHRHLDRVDGQRRIGRNRVGVIFHEGLEFGRRHDAIDEPHRARLFGIELPRREENFLGKRGTDEIDQPLHADVAVAEPKLGGRNAKLGIVRTDAHVGAQRKAETAADAIAADHRDRRLWKIVDAGKGLVAGRL